MSEDPRSTHGHQTSEMFIRGDVLPKAQIQSKSSLYKTAFVGIECTDSLSDSEGNHVSFYASQGFYFDDPFQALSMLNQLEEAIHKEMIRISKEKEDEETSRVHTDSGQDDEGDDAL